MSTLARSLELPLNLLDSQPTQFLQELRSAVAGIRRDDPLYEKAELLDIVFKRGKEGLVVTLYFANTKP